MIVKGQKMFPKKLDGDEASHCQQSTVNQYICYIIFVSVIVLGMR